jgi:hypothetical protein
VETPGAVIFGRRKLGKATHPGRSPGCVTR